MIRVILFGLLFAVTACSPTIKTEQKQFTIKDISFVNDSHKPVVMGVLKMESLDKIEKVDISMKSETIVKEDYSKGDTLLVSIELLSINTLNVSKTYKIKE
jgi:hypothetical protein